MREAVTKAEVLTGLIGVDISFFDYIFLLLQIQIPPVYVGPI